MRTPRYQDSGGVDTLEVILRVTDTHHQGHMGPGVNGGQDAHHRWLRVGVFIHHL